MGSVLRKAAALHVLPGFGKAQGRHKLSQGSFREIVSDADIAASSYILKSARARFPGSFSEEHLFKDRFEHKLVWQIDPIDGTDEYCGKMADGYSMNAALLEKQGKTPYTPIAGIIYLPGKDEMWCGDGKSVAFLENGARKNASRKANDSLCGWIRKTDPNAKLADCYRKIGGALGMDVKLRYGGGSGASMAELLSGTTNLVIMNYDYTKEWDIAMAEPMIRAMGGFICDFDGKAFEYNRKTGNSLPYNYRGYVASVDFKRGEIVSRLPRNLLIRRL